MMNDLMIKMKAAVVDDEGSFLVEFWLPASQAPVGREEQIAEAYVENRWGFQMEELVEAGDH